MEKRKARTEVEKEKQRRAKMFQKKKPSQGQAQAKEGPNQPFHKQAQKEPTGAANSPNLRQIRGEVHQAAAPREAHQQHVAASGAVPREAGVAAPRAPPSNVNDYPTQVSPSLPLGGRLAYFVRAWESVTSNQWVLNTITKGYQLEFTASPPVARMHKEESGEWQPILNLKSLNHYIRPRKFRMETRAAVICELSPGWWGATLNLKVPIFMCRFILWTEDG